MPRQNDPADITVGSGLASNESIETNAFIHPTGGQEGLRVHIQDPSRAHEARAINVIDTPNNFASDHVEGALEELATSGAAGRTNGLLEGGEFTSSVGLTFELDATTNVLLNGTVHDKSGDQVALTPSTTQYVFINSSTGNLTASTLLPILGTNEPILIAEVTTDGVGIVSSRDLRFFVLNLDRKVALTVRSGSNAESRSEAQFITLEAALTYLELYAGAGGPDTVETHHIIVRGSHDISSTFTLPVEGIIFEGDGTGEFVDNTGGGTLFTVDVDKTRFKNLLFTANDPSTVVFDGTDPIDFIIENCEFDADGDSFGQLVNLSNVNIPGIQRFRMVNCQAQCYAGVYIEKTTDCRIEDSRFTGTGGSAGGTTCIEFGASAFASQGFDILRGVRMSGFEVGVSVASNNFTMVDSYMNQIGTDGVVSSGPYTTIRNVQILLDATNGVSGISLSDEKAVVESCTIENPRTTWSGEDPIGILLTAAADARISNCTIDGFLEDTVPDGAGIQADGDCPDLRIHGNLIVGCYQGVSLGRGTTEANVQGNTIEGQNTTVTGILALGTDAAGDRTHTINISNNLVKGCVSQGIYLFDYVHNVTVAGNTVNGFIGTGTEVSAYGIRVETSAGEPAEYLNVDGNTVFNSTHGIIFDAVAGSPTSRSSITNNLVHHIAVGTAPADTFDGAGALGIGLNESSNIVVSGNQLFSIGELINEDGSTFSPAAADYGAQGIYCLNTSEITIEGNNVRDTLPAGTGDGRGIGVRHRQNSGPRTAQGFIVSGNILTGTADSSIDVQVADSLSAGAQSIKGVSIEGNSILGSGAAGIRILAVTDSTILALSISDNTIEDAANNGINLDATASGAVIEAPSITSNSIEEPGLNGVVLTAAFASALISGAVVSGNSVLRAGNYGIYALGSVNATLPDGVMPGLKIHDNSIDSSTDDGIRVEATAFGVIIGTTVNDNTVLAAGGEGIYFRAASGAVSGVQAHGNTVSRPTDNGFLATATGVGGSLTDINLEGNVVNDPGASGIEFAATGPNVLNFQRLTVQSCAILNPADKGIHVSADEEDILDVTIRDCRIDAASGSTMTYGILVVTLDTTARQDVNRVTITNNIVHDPFTTSATAGIEVFARGNIVGSAVHGNEVTMAGRDLFGIRVESFYDFGAEVLSVEHNISDNKIVLDTVPTVGGTGGAGIALYGFSPAGNLGAKLADVTISNNNLLYTGKGIDVATGARVTGGDNFDQIGTLKVHGNVITNCLRQAIHIRSPNTNGFRGATLQGGVVTDNTISYANTDDFDCGVIDVRSTTPMRNWVVNQNNVSYTGSAAAAGTAPAIYVFGGIGGFGFQNIDVSRNVVWDCNTGDGVLVELADAGAVRNINVDYNAVRQIEDHGVKVILTDATTSENVSVVGNKTNDTGLNGIDVLTPDSTTMQNLKVDHNMVTNAAGTGIIISCDDAGRNWSIIGNHVHDSSTYGLHLNTSTGKDTTVLSTLVVSNNTAYNISGGLTIGLEIQLQRSVLRLVYANNSVSDADTGHSFLLGNSAGSEGTLNTASFLGNVSGNVGIQNVSISGTNTATGSGSTPVRVQAQANVASPTGNGWANFVTETGASTTGNTN